MKKEKLFDPQLKKDHYHAKALVLWCFDCRFREAREQYLEHHGFDDHDLVSVAGGIGDLVRGTEAEKNYILKQIGLGIRLHHAYHIPLMAHCDCGYYKAAFAESGHTEWHDFLEADLKVAHDIVREYCQKNGHEAFCKDYWASQGKPIDGITIQPVIADFDGVYHLYSPDFAMAIEHEDKLIA
jgi:hypothetical protein